MTLKESLSRIEELEAMVAMASPPSLGKYPVPIVFTWVEEQKRIQKKLDNLGNCQTKQETTQHAQLSKCVAPRS